MGYEIELTDAQFSIPKANLDEAWRRFQALNQPEMDFAKQGGSWRGGGKQESWYSWMDADYDKTLSSAKEVFEMLGFETEYTTEGDLALVYYCSKTGQEDLFLYAIRDLVEPGSYLRFQGEDGAMYESSFDNGEMYQRGGGWIVTEPAKVALVQETYGVMVETETKDNASKRVTLPV